MYLSSVTLQEVCRAEMHKRLLVSIVSCSVIFVYIKPDSEMQSVDDRHLKYREK